MTTITNLFPFKRVVMFNFDLTSVTSLSCFPLLSGGRSDSPLLKICVHFDYLISSCSTLIIWLVKVLFLFFIFLVCGGRSDNYIYFEFDHLISLSCFPLLSLWRAVWLPLIDKVATRRRQRTHHRARATTRNSKCKCVPILGNSIIKGNLFWGGS